MSIQMLGILLLAGIFLGAALLPLNMGLLGFAAAFALGLLAAGLSAKEVLAGFPADLFLTLVGVTYLFAFAQANGAIDRLVDTAAAALGSRAVLMPWLVFGLAGLLTALGAFGPAAVAMLAPVALRFASQYRISPLMMGLMLVHGTQAGAFSPSSVYGGITNAVVERAGMSADAGFLSLASLAANALLAAIIFLLLGGLRLGDGADGSHVAVVRTPLTREQGITWAALALLAVGALVLDLNIGFVAMGVIVLLSLCVRAGHAEAEKRVGWSTVLLICGIVTYVGVLEKTGTVGWLGDAVRGVGSPLLAALLLCMVAGVVSAFASSTALLGVLIPLAAPLLTTGELAAAGLVAAIAVSTTVVDTSPFSTNGALVVASAEEDRRPSLLRQLLAYTALIVVAGPLLAWALFVVARS